MSLAVCIVQKAGPALTGPWYQEGAMEVLCMPGCPQSTALAIALPCTATHTRSSQLLQTPPL